MKYFYIDSEGNKKRYRGKVNNVDNSLIGTIVSRKQDKYVAELTKESDPEIVEMAQMELEEINGKDEKLLDELKILLLPKDENDEKNVIMEIRGAAGGEEANIFAVHHPYYGIERSYDKKQQHVSACPFMQRGVGILYNANYAVCAYPYKKRTAGHGDHTGPGAKYIYRHGVYYIEAYGSDKSRLPALELGQLLPLVVFAYILSLLF